MGNVMQQQKAEWWVFDLVRQVGQQDRQDISDALGYPRVANGFRKTLGEAAEALDVGGYSSTEVAAAAQALEWLKAEFREHFDCVREYMRAGRVNDDFLLAQSMVLVGQKVDEIVGWD